jgi:hypothetical protein
MPRLRRKKLVAVLAYTLAMASLLNAAADAWRLKYYRPKAPRSNMNAYVFQQSGQPVDILFLGSSRSRQGINTNLVMDVLQEAGHEGVSAFNVAQPALGTVTAQIMLGDLIRSNGCPGIVVLEVSPSSLNQNGDWWPAVGDYASVRHAPVVLQSVTNFERLDFLLVSALRGGMRFYDRLARSPGPQMAARTLATRGSLHGDLAGRPGPVEQGPGNRSIRMARNLYRRKFWRNLDIGGSTTAALRRCAVLAEGCRARLVLVRMPTLIGSNPEDREGGDLPFLGAIGEFEASHDVVFLDAHATDIGIQRDHFRDPVHLNLGGSIVFGEYLAREVLLPLLEQED